MTKKTLNNDPEWKFAPILVTSNFERIIVNEKKSILFAKEKGEIVFRWKIECKIVRGEGSIDDLDDVDDCPELFAYFVKGAPLIITKNINPNKNIANGTSGFYHSMLFDDEEMNKKFSELELCTNVGEIITLSQPPDYIIVKLDRTINSESNLSIDNNISLIPISRKDNFFPMSYKVWIKNRKISNYPVQVELVDNQGVQMAFSYTFHKAVGQTIPKLISCLSKRPYYLCQISYRLLLVALSRVEESKYMRILSDPKEDLSYLINLKAPDDYFIWMKGFDKLVDGKWNENLSVTEWMKLEDKNNMKKNPKKERCIKSIKPLWFPGTKPIFSENNKNDEVKDIQENKSKDLFKNLNDSSILQKKISQKNIKISNERELYPKYIEFEQKINDVYKMPKKDNLNDDSLMRIIFWYKFRIGSCFYDSVLFCLKNSKWENIVHEYENGLELRNDSLNWIKTLKEKKSSPI